MHAAMDAGLTFIDTAEGYMNAEAIIGKSIKGRRGELFIATKVSGDDHSTEHIHEALNNSLRLMGTDTWTCTSSTGPPSGPSRTRWPTCSG